MQVTVLVVMVVLMFVLVAVFVFAIRGRAVVLKTRNFDLEIAAAAGRLRQHQPVTRRQAAPGLVERCALLAVTRRVLESDQVGARHLQHQVNPPGFHGQLGRGDGMFVRVGPANLVLRVAAATGTAQRGINNGSNLFISEFRIEMTI